MLKLNRYVLTFLFIFFVASYQNCAKINEQVINNSTQNSLSPEDNPLINFNQDERFQIGFALYSAHFNEIKIRHGIDIKKIWVQNLIKQGFNLFYIGISATNDDLKSWIQLSEELDFKFIAISSSDFTKTDDEIVDLHVKILKNNWGHKNLIAYSIGEEPKIENMSRLDEIYTKLNIQFSSPQIRFHLLHNSLKSAGTILKNKIHQMATDRYAFWGWDDSSGGFSATPFYALRKWLESQIRSFEEKTSLNDSEFQIFLTANRLFRVSKIPTDLTARIDKLATDENMGWHILNKDYYLNVKYYSPPVNTIKASIWLSIIHNAKGVFFWTGMPTDPVAQSIIDSENGMAFIPENICPTKALKNTTAENFKLNLQCNLKEFNVSSVGTFTKNNNNEITTINYPSMAEIVEVNKEISKLGLIIKKMKPELSGWVDSPPQDTIQRYFEIYNKEGSLIPGRILMTLNLNVGQWDSNSIKSTIGSYKKFIIDRKGELVNYIPNKDAQKFTLPDYAKKVFDLVSEKEIVSSEIMISPGGVSLIFIGDSDQFSELLKSKNN